MPADESLKSTQHEAELVSPPATAPSKSPPTGQLGTFALLGAAIGSVPLPWLPSALARRVRGALVQDIAAPPGVTLSAGARGCLAEPTGGGRKKQGAVSQAFGYIGRKLLMRFGPLAVLPTLRGALETYVLGYLFDRYLTRAARDGSRFEVSEARLVRGAMERAVLRVANPEGGLHWPTTPTAPEELRDELTQALDGLLSATSTVPSWLLHRLDVCFAEALDEAVDEALAEPSNDSLDGR